MRVSSVRDLQALARARRKALHLTQQQLAVRMGVSRKWVYNFESGAPNAVELALVLRLLAALELNLDAREQDASPAGDGPGVSVVIRPPAARIDLNAHLAQVSVEGGLRPRRRSADPDDSRASR